jgi:hypothetical protein
VEKVGEIMKRRVKAFAIITNFGIARDIRGRYGMAPIMAFCTYKSETEAKLGVTLPSSERAVECTITYDDGIPSKKVPKKRKKK